MFLSIIELIINTKVKINKKKLSKDFSYQKLKKLKVMLFLPNEFGIWKE